MSVLKFEKAIIRSASFGGESSLPPIGIKLNLNDTNPFSNLDESEGLFVNYGEMPSAYPYRAQDMYDR